MSFKNFLNKKVVVTQTGSSSKLTDRQKSNLIGLGLRGIGSKSDLLASESVLGMVKKVSHVVDIKA